MQSGNLLGRRAVRDAVLVAALISLSGSVVFGRAGYYHAPSGGTGGYGRGSIKRGMPHHNLGAARLPGGPVIPRWSSGGSFRGAVGGEFTGSGSDGSNTFTSTWHATQTAPYRTDTRYQPPYYHNYNSYWLHGYWGGGLWGWGRWCGNLGIWSLPRWSMGPIYYPSGYGLFRNPFVDGVRSLKPADQIYSLPIRIRPDDRALDADPSSENEPARIRDQVALKKERQDLVRSPQEIKALKAFDDSREQFRMGDYEAALTHAEAALTVLPDDVALHQYRALILFARGEYRRAAITLYAVISASPGFDWATLGSFYPEQARYTAELRKLEAYHKANPETADAAFLLSYHYLSCRHFEPALRKMQTVAQLLPRDNLAPELITFLKGAVEYESQPITDGPESPEKVAAELAAESGTQPAPSSDNASVDAAALVGKWSAKRSKDIQVDLTFTADGHFHWTATERGMPRESSGEYATQGDRMILSGPHGTVLAQWKQPSPARLNFKLQENDPADVGLEFVKAN